MNHAERVKHLIGNWAEQLLVGRKGYGSKEIFEELDAMQSALDDAVGKAKLLGEELERVTDERNAAGGSAEDAVAKLAARDAEVERLRKDAERFKRLEKYLKRHGLLEKKFCKPSVFTECSVWWLFWPVYSVDHTRAPLGYGYTATKAIDAALSEEVKGGE